MRCEPNGLSAWAVQTVKLGDCASQWGNPGLEVLSTPAVLGNMERICAEAMAPYLESGEITVGVKVTMNHRAPTPLDSDIEYYVSAPAVDRKTEFSFKVRDENGTVVCEGTHMRAVTEVTGLRERAAAVLNRPGRDATPARRRMSEEP